MRAHRAEAAERERAKRNERQKARRLRAAIIERDGELCCCGEPATELDHYPIPLAYGGPSTLNNLRLSCRACNTWTSEEYREWLEQHGPLASVNRPSPL
jgi:5-methylcytosine-specific restriction endonuclease McrA